MKTDCARREVRGLVLAGCFVGLLLAAGCKQAPPPDTKAAEQAVRDADTQGSKAAQAHNLAGVFADFADDATMLPANSELLTSKGAVQQAWIDMLTPAVDLSWTPMYVEAAKSGDMVYVVGSYTMTTKAAKGKGSPTADHGKYLSVWKKQADGSWKVEADTWNSDLPVAGAKKRA